jgi:hypothetical protein
MTRAQGLPVRHLFEQWAVTQVITHNGGAFRNIGFLAVL